MNYKTITERLKRVAAIVDSWKGADSVPQIERDIALEELRSVYNQLLVVDAEQVAIGEEAESDEEIEVEVVVETPVEDEAPSTSDVASMEAFYDALDIDALLGITDEPVKPVAEQPASVEPSDEVVKVAVEERTPEAESVESQREGVAEMREDVAPVVESAVVVEREPEQSVVSTPEPVEQPAAEEVKPVGAGLFDLNDIPVRSKSKRKMISLYSDNPIPAVAEPAKREAKSVASEPEVAVTPEPVAASKVEEISEAAVVSAVESVSGSSQRLGDSFGEVKTLADQIAKDDAPTTPFNRITELRQAIGLNDKFLMIRDLFGGDAERYEATIDTLDEFDDLDECIIYIVENFRWNPDLEAAKLLVSLIERKLA